MIIKIKEDTPYRSRLATARCTKHQKCVRTVMNYITDRSKNNKFETKLLCSIIKISKKANECTSDGDLRSQVPPQTYGACMTNIWPQTLRATGKVICCLFFCLACVISFLFFFHFATFFDCCLACAHFLSCNRTRATFFSFSRT